MRPHLAILLACAAAASASAAEPNAPAGANTQPLRLVVFNSQTCARGCLKVAEHVEKLRGTWGDRVRTEVLYIDASAADAERNLALLLAYDRHYQSGAKTTPVAYVGHAALNGDEAILTRLEVTIQRELIAGTRTYEPTEADMQALFQGAAGGQSEGRWLLDQVSVAGVAMAGLVDGVNPCAFTTIIFLLSMLAYLGKGKRELLAVGAGFALSIFAAYFLFGLGILSAAKHFSVHSGLARGLNYAVGGLALVLAAWSFVDFVRYVRSKDTKDITLRLPRALKGRIHSVIRRGLKARNLFFASMGVGLAVAVLEGICTGQIYLPVVAAIAANPTLRVRGVAYLLLYNVMFMLPLLALMAACYAGVGSERLAQWLRGRLGLIKLALALLFALLGTVVILTA